MFRLSVADSALEGFRITREKPAAVAVWAVLVFVGALLSGALMTAPGVTDLMLLARSRSPAAPDPAQTAAVVAALARGWPQMLALTVVNFAVSVVLYTAVLRAVFAPSASERGFYLRLGPDEGRQALLAFLALLAWLGYALLVSTVAGALIAVAATAGGVGVLLGALVVALLTVALIYPLVRLSLAPAATFTARRVRLFDTWGATRGLFWPLVGVYLMALALAFLVYFLLLLIVAAAAFVVAALSGGGLEAVPNLLQPDTSSLPGLLSPFSLLAMAFSAVVTTPATVVVMASAAGAWRQIPPAAARA